MPFINFTNVATMLLTLVVFLLALVLSKETKKSRNYSNNVICIFINSCFVMLLNWEQYQILQKKCIMQ